MAAKHSVRVFGTARFVLSFAVAILVLLVVWVAVRAVGPAEASKAPSLVLPAPSLRVTPAAPTRTPSRSPAPSKTSATPRATTPTPERTRPTTTRPARTTAPPPATDVEATLSVRASWEDGYVAAVRVVNDGDKPVSWRVTVSHSRRDDVELRGVWNASGNQQGNSIVFTGGTLQPGATATFGYQTSSGGRGGARPAACNAVGGSCSVR
ncbi:cellulose binding domain-containing protein [Actinoplanes sp. URMC 104]|uniref:cellulose binding domain-containing protein n=1 Tax=Actinoplanes sp. URMC 104 TaxID=3423409 RepID=UPI003F1C0EBF